MELERFHSFLVSALIRGLFAGVGIALSTYIVTISYNKLHSNTTDQNDEMNEHIVSNLNNHTSQPKSEEFSVPKSTSDDSYGQHAELVTTRTTKQTKSRNIIEVCVSDIESVENCRDSGVDSVEICSHREIGGITPSLGLVEEAVQLLKSTNIEVHVLIRPRPGNFRYSDREFDIILRDIISMKNAGVDGIVVGCLHSDGSIDIERLQIIRSITHGIKLTFHRAFDVCEDAIATLDMIINCSCDRLLTSGRAACAGSLEGVNMLTKLVLHAKNGIQIIAGGGIDKSNCEEILSFTGVNGIHVGSSVTVLRTLATTTCTSSKQTDIKLGLYAEEDLNTWAICDKELIRNLTDSIYISLEENAAWRPIDNTPIKETTASITTTTNTTSNISNLITTSKDDNKPSKGRYGSIYVIADDNHITAENMYTTPHKDQITVCTTNNSTDSSDFNNLNGLYMNNTTTTSISASDVKMMASSDFDDRSNIVTSQSQSQSSQLSSSRNVNVTSLPTATAVDVSSSMATSARVVTSPNV